jgi:citrate lyase beta subunit
MSQDRLWNEGREALDALAAANRDFARMYPGERGDRQPVHTVYGGAHLFSASTAGRLGELARRSVDTYAPVAGELTDLGIPVRLCDTVYARVRAKLEREPVEDFRIDFEDGYGVRPDAEEDETAVRAARETATGLEAGTLPPFIGIRIKPFSEESVRRSVRTLDLYVTTLVEAAGRLPDNFVVTLPKVVVPEQVATLVALFEKLEARLSLAPGSLVLEPMIEMTQTLFDARGRSNLPLIYEAAAGRCGSAHFGTYDYTASFGITAAYQAMRHPACDLAKNLMRIAFAGTGVFLSDGATNVMPVGPHRGELTAEQAAENRRVVHAAWKLAYDDIRHSLQNGYYQGWDLHPAQLPIRYAACYTFFLESFDAAAERLRNFIDKAAQATLIGDVFDDAATGQGLLNYFSRALGCGAISVDELKQTGLEPEEIQIRSFARILEHRRTRLA